MMGNRVSGRPGRPAEKQAAKTPVSWAGLFWIFLLGSVVGFVLEGIWNILRKGVWESHPATVWGPFCIIYGLGAVALALCAPLLQGRRLLTQFLFCAAAGTLVEYLGGLGQKAVLGSVSWDYSRHTFNLGGRISLMMTLIWGSLGIAFLRWILPALSRVLGKMETPAGRFLCLVLCVVMAGDLLVSAAALLRWRERSVNDAPAGNAVEQVLDQVYGDERMTQRYPSMWFAPPE